MTQLRGRAHEFSELDRFLAAARGGNIVGVALEGARGQGKSELLNAFLARHRTLPALRAAAARWERATAFALVNQLGVAGADHQSVVRALLSVFSDAAVSGGPVVVAIDDAHWADVPSLQALASAAQRATEGLLLILTVDPVSAASEQAAVFDLLEEYRRHVITLHPLGPSDVNALAEDIIGTPLSAPIARRLADHTAGNPSFIVRILREADPATWARWSAQLPVPNAERAHVTAILGETDADARELIEAAAILGDVSALGAAASLAETTNPLTALDLACATKLVTTDVTRPAMVVQFASPLTRTSVLATISPLRWHELHTKAAALATSEGDRLNHLAAAQPTTDAALSDRLDEYAKTRAANGEWAACADALIKASHLSPSTTLRQDRLIRGVDALVGAGAIPHAEMLVPEIESFDDSALRDAVLGYLAMMRGRPAEAELLLRRAWQNADTGSSVAASVGQRYVLDSLARWDGRRLLEWSDRVAQITTPTAPEAIEAAAINGLGLAITGELAAAMRMYSNEVAETIVGAQSQRFRMGKGWLASALDHYDDARLLLESAVPTEYRFGSIRISLWAQGWLARVQFALGEWDDALRTVESAAADASDSGIDLIRPLIHWTGAQISVLRGDDAAAQRHLRLARTTTHGYLAMYIPSCLAQAHYAEAHADYDGVLRALAPLTRVAPSSDFAGFWPWADIYANALVMSGRLEEAARFLTPYENAAHRISHKSSLARFGSVRGRILGATAGIDEARGEFERALQAIGELPQPYGRARVAFAYGQTLRRAGKRRDADTIMRAARDTFAGLRATAYTERCDRELKAAGVNIKRSRDSISDLTEQERAVVALVAAGKTNKQAADELFLSVKTIQYHLTRIYAKLQLRSRTELVAYVRDSR